MNSPVRIRPGLAVDVTEIEFTAMRASGSGGQHVNKTNSAVHLRYSIEDSSLPDNIKRRLLQTSHHHITDQGDILIRCEDSRSQFRNRKIALQKFKTLLYELTKPPKTRLKTRPSRGTERRRLAEKKHRGEIKRLRGQVRDFDG